MLNSIERTMCKYPQLTYTFMSFPNDKQGGIIIDDEILINSNRSQCKQYQDLNEEIAHYETTVGDISKQETIDDRQQEHVARSRAMERVINLDGLVTCFQHQIWTDYEVAEYFGVEIDYLRTAINHWKERCGILFRHKGYWIDLSRGINISRI